ncbi:efflux transporter outer membrane subunit [Novosphingobium sp. AP12]|uniref:efflux transporter outer membrane subunit n=1 Tax=Novosphingobium sp. AP12 TaxID=1144305 RepID=UPI000271FAD6|nr:efflux transporter outer membrane subunit [Novosphingobium sp. AP12]EJL34192.1 efflux transporter, outer membrane factor lipoprotein, NodT family [Novosphingobium sp. AP12]
MKAERVRRVALHFMIAGSLLLSGCMEGPDWHKPVATLPPAFAPPVGDPAASQAEASDADPAWWNVFADPELTSLASRVAAANLDVAEATTRLSQSRSARRIAGSARYPSVNGNASYARERASPNGVLGLLGTTERQSSETVANGGPGFGPAAIPGGDGSPPFDLWQYGFDASWELDLWGGVRRGVEASDAALEASSYARRGILVTALAETARDYLQLRGVQAQIAITRQNLDIATHTLSLTQLRLANGATTNLDVANAGAQVSAVKAVLPALLRDEAQLINALSLLLGAPPRALAAELAVAMPIPSVPSRFPIGLPSSLARQRPDIREAEARLHEATAQIGVAKADFYPRITLSGSLDIQALQLSNLGTWGSRQFGFGPAVSLPIFQGGRLRGTLELRQAQQKQAAIVYQRTVLQAWHEVDDALTAYNAAQDQRDQWQETVRQARIALAAAEAQYKQGAIDFLNVLTVQDRLLTSQRSYTQSSTETAVALTSLYKALGGGWQIDFPAQTTRANSPSLVKWDHRM